RHTGWLSHSSARRRDAGLSRQGCTRRTGQGATLQVFRESWPNMLRVGTMALAAVIPAVVVTFGAVYATNPAYRNGFTTTNYLWISTVANAVALVVIPLVGRLSD